MADRIKITKRIIERLPSSVDKESWIFDTEVTGFGVRMRPGARHAFAMRWKDGVSRDRKMTIAPVNQIELDDARAIAKQRFGEVAAGDNPIEERKAERRANHTIADLIEDAERDLEEKGRAASYIRDFKQQMRDYVKPTIGAMLVRDVSPSDIDRILAKLAKKPATHNRVRAGLSRLFTFAIRHRYRADNPVLGTTPRGEQARTRLLSGPELDAILAELARRPGSSSDAMRLLYLTGSRPKELFRAKWQDIDLAEGIWTKPAQTVKQRRLHRVQLQNAALAVLRRMLEDMDKEPKPDDYVFPSPRPGKDEHLTTIKHFATSVFKAAGVKDVRPYDLRKAFASRLVASGADLKTVMSLTGHTQVNVLMRHYAQLMDGKQKEVLEKVFG
jgi:integrase